MTWDYRVFRKHHTDGDSVTYHVHEVYYDEEGEIKNWTVEPEEPKGDTSEELLEDIRYFLNAFRLPVLEEIETEQGLDLVEIDTSDEIYDGDYVRLVDRASVAVNYVNQFLGSHPLVMKEPGLKRLYGRIHKALVNLHKEVARMASDQEGVGEAVQQDGMVSNEEQRYLNGEEPNKSNQNVEKGDSPDHAEGNPRVEQSGHKLGFLTPEESESVLADLCQESESVTKGARAGEETESGSAKQDPPTKPRIDIVLSDKVVEKLKDLPLKDSRGLAAAIEALRENPYPRNSGRLARDTEID